LVTSLDDRVVVTNLWSISFERIVDDLDQRADRERLREVSIDLIVERGDGRRSSRTSERNSVPAISGSA